MDSQHSKFSPYIACFGVADHADVRLLSCQVANDLSLTSTTVFNCLMNCAQNDSANHVKAAAIKSLTNFKPTDKLIKLLTWAARFENSWAVRLASVNALGQLNSECRKFPGGVRNSRVWGGF